MLSNKKFIVKGNTMELEYSNDEKEGVFVCIGNARDFDFSVYCREEYRWDVGFDNNYIGFYLVGIDATKVNRFFEYIENLIKLDKKTIVYETNVENLIVLEAAPFWKNDIVKGDLFTLFLRCAAAYYITNFDKAINRYKLTKKAKDAIYYFLDGNIHPNYSPLCYDEDFLVENFQGFVDTFSKMNKEDLSRSLLKSW